MILEELRHEERAHVRALAREHGLELAGPSIEFAEGGYTPYIGGMPAEDWIEQAAMRGQSAT